MDQIRITIEQEEALAGALFVVVFVNEKRLPGILNPDTFFRITKDTDELLPLLTCDCGDFDCDGSYVHVIGTTSSLQLYSSYHRFTRALESFFHYTLDWRQVRMIAQQIVDHLQTLHAQQPSACVTTGYGGDNLLEALPRYRQSALLSI